MQPAAGKIKYDDLKKRISANVRYWPKADITIALPNVRLSGVKRTSRKAQRQIPQDPKTRRYGHGASLLASWRCLSTKPRRYGKPRWLRLSWRDRYNIDELWYAPPYPLV
jgi:hypothetical protein